MSSPQRYQVYTPAWLVRFALEASAVRREATGYKTEKLEVTAERGR